MRRDTGLDFATALPMLLAQAEMRPRERLVWAERAMRGTGLRQIIARTIFGIVFAGFAAFWMAMAYLMSGAGGGEADPLFRWFPLFGLPFFIVGVALVIAPILRLGAPPAVYALSSERIIAISGRRGERVQSYDLVTLAEVRRVERRDGSGDLLFGGRGGLVGVPDVRRVADELERLRRLAIEEQARIADRPASEAS